MAKVSVLIPAYNVEQYIHDSIGSVMAQTFTDWEIVVVDDCSTDNTLAILNEYASKDSRIHVYAHETNRGQSCGRNTALSHATGEYVYMLDADDKIAPNLLQDMVELFDAENLDVAGFETENYCDDPRYDANVKIKTVKYRELPVMNGLEALNYCVYEESLSSSTPTYFMRKSYLDRINLRFVEGILHEDVGYLFELIVRADRVTFIPKIYFHRRIRMNSTMTRGFTDKNIEGYFRSVYRAYDLEETLVQKYGDTDFLRKTLAKWRRDMFGRARQLYLQSEETIYYQNGGHVSPEMQRLFQTIKMLSVGEGQAKDVLGEDAVNTIRESGIHEVYLMGLGQYTERMIHIMGALDVAICGIIVPSSERYSAFGIKLYTPDNLPSELLANKVPVVYSVSHYYDDVYSKICEECGLTNIIKVNF